MSKAAKITRLDKIIRHKFKRLSVKPGVVWYGYLTPVEFIHVAEVWKLKMEDDKTDAWLKSCRDSVKRGESYTIHYYFIVTKADQKRLQLDA